MCGLADGLTLISPLPLLKTISVKQEYIQTGEYTQGDFVPVHQQNDFLPLRV